MGLFDFITGGDKPERRGPTGAERKLISATDRLDSRRGGLTHIAGLYADSLAQGRRGERSDFIGAGAADVQQQFGGSTTGNNQALENALRRGRGLARITQSRADEFDSQLLRDRVAFTRGSQQRRGRGLNALMDAASIREGVAGAQRARKMSDKRGRANMLGTAAGIGLGFAANRFGGGGSLFEEGGGSPANTGATVDPTAVNPGATRSYA